MDDNIKRLTPEESAAYAAELRARRANPIAGDPLFAPVYRWLPDALPCAAADFDGDLRVSRVEGETPYWCASGPLAWRGTSRTSPEDAARDFARQTAVHFGALTLTFPDGHTERFGDAEASIVETFARERAAADTAVTEHALRVMGGEATEPAPAWCNTPSITEKAKPQ